MRDCHLKTTLSDLGGTFGRRNGIEILLRFESEETEYYYVRDHVGLTDFSFMQKYIFPGEEGVELLDKIFPGNIAKLRFGRILHTFLPNDDGDVIADCYIANNDDEIVVLCESIVGDAENDAIFSEYGGNEAGMKNITETHSVLNLDGFNAWKVVKEQFGLDVLSLPYLTWTSHNQTGMI